MHNRYGVVMVLFDLPMTTSEDRRIYSRFVAELKRGGYQRYQNSVYIKLIRNISSVGQEIVKVKNMTHPHGSVKALPMNMSTFRSMVNIQGQPFNLNLFADDVIVIED